MAVAQDFSSQELTWLAMIERQVGVIPPAAIRARLTQASVTDDDPLGLRITGMGGDVLSEARGLGLLPQGVVARDDR
jgi:hypothetical protein